MRWNERLAHGRLPRMDAVLDGRSVNGEPVPVA